VYASAEIHSCNQKAVELLWLGSNSLRKVPVKEDFTIDLNALEAALSADRAAGCRPICIIGSAAIANHRSKKDDFEILAREVVGIGRELVGQLYP
jgi:glutamate/tyrosine decarboxylase-like PLP-dependent enzyme